MTGLRIIDAILNGERSHVKLSRLRDERCRNDEATIAKALVGTWRDEHLFSLKLARDLYRVIQQLVVECDAKIEAHLKTFVDRPIEKLPDGVPPNRKKPVVEAVFRSMPRRCLNIRSASI